jgi:glucosylceramidase
VGAAFDAAGLDTMILGYDHNWSEHPGDIASTPPGEDPETDYPYRLLRSPQKQRFDGIAYHCYAGDPSDMTKLHDAFPGTEIWFTECSGSHGPTDPPAQVFSDTLKWHSRNLVLGVTRNWSSTVVNWNLALDPTGGPHNGGCDTCTGVVTVGPGQTVTRNAEYYTLGHLARFVRPGAHRIASTSFGTTGWNGAVMDTAFRNPDGTIVLVAHNENDAPATFAVAQGGSSFDYTLPGGALATFVWPSSAALDDGHRLLDLHGATVVASEGADAGRAVDDDAVTRWTTGAAQHAGQTLTVDLHTTRDVGRVALDTGALTEADVNWGPGQPSGDYPRRLQVSTSTDDTTWSAPVSATGSGQITTVDLTGGPARYVRLVQTGSSQSWWSVADLRLYT